MAKRVREGQIFAYLEEEEENIESVGLGGNMIFRPKYVQCLVIPFLRVNVAGIFRWSSCRTAPARVQRHPRTESP